jgi:hypothetical protein
VTQRGFALNPHWGQGDFFSGRVVPGGLVVEGEFAEELAGRLADDADVQVLDEDQDLRPGVLAADADVVELAGVAAGDGADGPDLVGADAVVGAADLPADLGRRSAGSSTTPPR